MSIAKLDWSAIDTVLLDMDGTLLDLHFDNFFWQSYLTQQYADKQRISVSEAAAWLQVEFARVEGTLNWYCLDYWQARLGLNIVDLKRNILHLIRVHEGAERFLSGLMGRKLLVLVTNAHRASLDLKLDRTGIDRYFDRIVSSHDYRVPKEELSFWCRLQADLGFQPARALLVEDSLRILDVARSFGVGHLLAISQPDSQQAVRQIDRYASIRSFEELLQAPQE